MVDHTNFLEEWRCDFYFGERRQRANNRRGFCKKVFLQKPQGFAWCSSEAKI